MHMFLHRVRAHSSFFYFFSAAFIISAAFAFALVAGIAFVFAFAFAFVADDVEPSIWRGSATACNVEPAHGWGASHVVGRIRGHRRGRELGGM